MPIRYTKKSGAGVKQTHLYTKKEIDRLLSFNVGGKKLMLEPVIDKIRTDLDAVSGEINTAITDAFTEAGFYYGEQINEITDALNNSIQNGGNAFSFNDVTITEANGILVTGYDRTPDPDKPVTRINIRADGTTSDGDSFAGIHIQKNEGTTAVPDWVTNFWATGEGDIYMNGNLQLASGSVLVGTRSDFENGLAGVFIDPTLGVVVQGDTNQTDVARVILSGGGTDADAIDYAGINVQGWDNVNSKWVSNFYADPDGNVILRATIYALAGELGNLTVTGNIESDIYVPGTTGFLIDGAAGEAFFQSVSIGGDSIVPGAALPNPLVILQGDDGQPSIDIAPEGTIQIIGGTDISVTTVGAGNDILQIESTGGGGTMDDWVIADGLNQRTISDGRVLTVTVPTGLKVETLGTDPNYTLAFTFDPSYSIPTNNDQADWDTAYTERGSQIDGTGLTWNGGTGELEVNANLNHVTGVGTLTSGTLFGIANAGGAQQFTVDGGDDIRFEGGTNVTVTFNPLNNRVIIAASNGGAMTSWDLRDDFSLTRSIGDSDIVQISGGTGLEATLTGTGPYVMTIEHSSPYAAFNPSNYVPVTGGTFTGDVTFSGSSGDFRGIQPGSTNMNLKIGTGDGGEPRIYLYGSTSPNSPNTVFIGANNGITFNNEIISDFIIQKDTPYLAINDNGVGGKYPRIEFQDSGTPQVYLQYRGPDSVFRIDTQDGSDVAINWAGSGGGLFVNGRVTVGTASFSTASGVQTQINAPSATNHLLWMGADAGYNNIIVSRGRSSANNYRNFQITANDIHLRTATTDEGTSSADRVIVKHTTGNVGIGTSPAYKLDVNGDARFSGNVGIGIAPAGQELLVSGGSGDTQVALVTNSQTSGGDIYMQNSTGYMLIRALESTGRIILRTAGNNNGITVDENQNTTMHGDVTCNTGLVLPATWAGA